MPILFYWTMPTTFSANRRDIMAVARRVGAAINSPKFAEHLDAHLPERSPAAALTMAKNEVAKGQLEENQIEGRIAELLPLTNTTDIRSCMTWVLDVIRAKDQPLRALYWAPADKGSRERVFLEGVLKCLGVTYQIWDVV